MASRAPVAVGYPSLEEIRANPLILRRGDVPTAPDLAFDLSSSAIGWALGHERKLVRYGKLVFKSTALIGEKLIVFEEFLDTLITVFAPKTCLVEKPLSRRAHTTARHHELLGVLRKVWTEHTATDLAESWLIAPITIKNTMQVERGADHTQNKIIMVNKINQLYGLRLKYDKNSKAKTDDDAADAIAVLTTYYRRNARSR